VPIGLAENGGDSSQDGCAFHVTGVEAFLAEFNANGLNKDPKAVDIERHDGSAVKLFYAVAPDGQCYWFGERQAPPAASARRWTAGRRLARMSCQPWNAVRTGFPGVAQRDDAPRLDLDGEHSAIFSLRCDPACHAVASRLVMTTNDLEFLAALSNQQLLDEVVSRAKRERRATAGLVAALAELDARRLYLAQGYASLFAYCTQALCLSEHAAYGRIEAARAARRFPLILELLADGSVTLTTITLLGPHLTDDNHERLLEAATHKSRRQVEQQLAALQPLPAHESRPAIIAMIAPELYSVQFTMTLEMYDRLRRVQDLMCHSIPTGDLAEIFDRGLTLLLRDLERAKLALTNRPRPAPGVATNTRHVPAAVRRAVWDRDGGQCAFVGVDGRCRERGFLELHHITPFAEGGQTTVANLELRCRSHNRFEGARHFGGWVVRESPGSYELS
jgi:HNH endonuclease